MTFDSYLENKPVFLLMVGAPGSGKTTWINEFLKTNKNYDVVSPDKIRKELYGSISEQGNGHEVWRIAKERVIDKLKLGINVILDATNTVSKKRLEFIEEIRGLAQLKAKVMEVDREEAKRRIAKDLENNVDRSAVPDFVVDRMFNQYNQDIKKLPEEGFEII